MNGMGEDQTPTEEGQAPEAPPEVVGSDKHIEFGGHEGPGVNIPGGLREPAPSSVKVPEGQYIEGYGTTEGQEPEAPPEVVGSDKHIEFGGHEGPGVNIPGGLREPEEGVTDSGK